MDCDVYAGTLEIFIEERHCLQMFIPDSDVKFKIPHSQAVHNCSSKFTFNLLSAFVSFAYFEQRRINCHCAFVNYYICMNFQVHVVLS